MKYTDLTREDYSYFYSIKYDSEKKDTFSKYSFYWVEPNTRKIYRRIYDESTELFEVGEYPENYHDNNTDYSYRVLEAILQKNPNIKYDLIVYDGDSTTQAYYWDSTTYEIIDNNHPKAFWITISLTNIDLTAIRDQVEKEKEEKEEKDDETSVDDVIKTVLKSIKFIDDVFDWLGTSMQSVRDGYDTVMNTVGFSSPFGKWPLKRRMNEPDTNRLARGETRDTPIEYIEKKRKTRVKSAFGSFSWSEPKIDFGGEYPYCQVTESESGHMSFQDDTPGKESKMDYHRAGTFSYTDYKGAKTNKIVGSNYTIIDKNGRIFIEGVCTVTVGRDVLLLVEKNLLIEVKGQTVLKSEKVYIN